MPSVADDDLPLVSWSGEAYRLIPSRFPPVNVYDGLAAPERLEELVAVENLTNPRLRSQDRLQAQSHTTAVAASRLQNWNLAPFAYGNPDGSTFFGEDRPCLELALDRQTALAVSAAKRERFLRATNEEAIGLDMRMLCTPVDGLFWDLREMDGMPARLEQRLRYEIGDRVPERATGVLFRPPERPTGTCVAILTGVALGRSQQSAHYRYLWDGKRVSKLYAFDDKGLVVDASKLATDVDAFATA